jgi:hypothetical protein
MDLREDGLMYYIQVMLGIIILQMILGLYLLGGILGMVGQIYDRMGDDR